MAETFKHDRKYDRRVAPALALDAVLHAADAVGMEPRRFLAQASWRDREARYNDPEEARARLRYGDAPDYYFVSAATPDYGRNAIVDLTVSAWAQGDLLMTLVRAEGSDYGRCRHALDAAVHVIDAGELPREPEPQASARLSPADADPQATTAGSSSPDAQPPVVASGDTSPSERRGGVRTWMNNNQGLLAAIGLILAIIGIVVAIAVA